MTPATVTKNQFVEIVDLKLDNGECFSGQVKSSEPTKLVIEHDPEVTLAELESHRNRPLTLRWRAKGSKHRCRVSIIDYRHGELTCKIIVEELRDSLRVRCNMELFYSEISEHEVPNVAEQLLSKVDAENGSESEAGKLLNGDDEENRLHGEMVAVRRLLEKMSNQLERLTQIVEGGGEQSSTDGRSAREVLDCSASGLAFRTSEPITPGTALKLKLVFDSAPKTTVECVGSVARCRRRVNETLHTDHYDVGIRFTHIHEIDRERIIRHIFKVQRMHLRDRHAATD